MLWKAYEGVLLEREEGAAFITLNDPANMNPVTVTPCHGGSECDYDSRCPAFGRQYAKR